MNAKIGHSPILDGLINKKFQDGVAGKVLLKTEKAGAFDGITDEKVDGVSNALLCFV